MLKFYIHTNLEKGILLGKALLSEIQIEKLPFNYENEYKFLLGTMYSLNKNYIDADQKLRSLITTTNNFNLKGLALNNLSVNLWQNKEK